MTDDLTARITAALDHAEQVARATVERRWVEGSLWFRWMMVPTKDGHGSEKVADEDARHMALWDPKNVLGLIAAHREILALHKPYAGLPYEGCETCVVEFGDPPEEIKADWPCGTVLAIAKAHRIEVAEPMQKPWVV